MALEIPGQHISFSVLLCLFLILNLLWYCYHTFFRCVLDKARIWFEIWKLPPSHRTGGAEKHSFKCLNGSQSTFVGKIKETWCGILNVEKPSVLPSCCIAENEKGERKRKGVSMQLFLKVDICILAVSVSNFFSFSCK